MSYHCAMLWPLSLYFLRNVLLSSWQIGWWIFYAVFTFLPCCLSVLLFDFLVFLCLSLFVKPNAIFGSQKIRIYPRTLIFLVAIWDSKILRILYKVLEIFMVPWKMCFLSFTFVRKDRWTGNKLIDLGVSKTWSNMDTWNSALHLCCLYSLNNP